MSTYPRQCDICHEGFHEGFKVFHEHACCKEHANVIARSHGYVDYDHAYNTMVEGTSESDPTQDEVYYSTFEFEEDEE